jgi:hypothetical protein
MYVLCCYNEIPEAGYFLSKEIYLTHDSGDWKFQTA